MPSKLSGFLLTRHWRDTPGGIELSLWVWTPEGPLLARFCGQRAVCFIAREQRLTAAAGGALRVERKPVQLETLDGAPVDALYCRHQSQLQQLRKQCTGAGIPLYESDLKPADRFLMERFITAGLRVEGDIRDHQTYLSVENPRLQPEQVQAYPSYLSLDIETDGKDGRILSIALCGQDREEILLLGDPAEWSTALPIHWYPDEPALLHGLLQRLRLLDPDLILGWNLINFDLDYLARRCRAHRIPFALGRADETAAILQPQQPKQRRIASIPGRVALDGIEGLRAAFWSFDSFALEHVAQTLLGRGKLIDGQQDKIGEIRRLFRDDRPALAAYNLEDARLVEAIFDHTHLIDFVLQRASMTGLSLGRQGGSVAAFDNLYLPRLHRAGAVAEDIGARHYDQGSPGGYVMDSQPGLYENVLVLDFKSLYPSIIRTFRIDPLGMARPGPDPVPGFLGAEFARDGAILPSIIDRLWAARDNAKSDNDRPLSQAIKITMNAFYGVLGSSGCRFYHPKLTSSITRRGHQIITRSRERLEALGYRVIYGDTDSLFVLLGPGYDETRSLATGHSLAAELNHWWRQRLQQEYRLESSLEIEFETHFLRFLMPTIRGAETGSKKRYAGYLRNAEGEFELRFKGLESVRSDWTPLARNFQQELYRLVFFDQPYAAFVRDTTQRLKRGELDDQLVYRKRLRRSLGDYRKNLPPHVQAARKLADPGAWIRYLITVNGPEPVEKKTSPIDYQHYIERQLAPAADGILHFLGDSFARLTEDQLALF